ncbi:MAG: endo alpha-1,4 polygalactosaminidase [Candidatus Thermoplasmatota archaeon]|nr:endo alpha-1,4 polygalactosaminidase [Candidatus Thermoplasmatota archaeon]
MKRSISAALFILMVICILTCGCLDDVEDNGHYNVSEPRQKMRDLVVEISTYSKGQCPDFIIITQNGNELVMSDTDPDTIDGNYTKHLDGVAQEDLFFGYSSDDEPTPAGETAYLERYLDAALSEGLTVLVTDYCSSVSNIDASYSMNSERDHVSFAAPRRDLDVVPDHPPRPFSVNTRNISSLKEIGNFLYLIDPGSFNTRTAYLEALGNTDHDLLIIDAFYDDTILTKEEVDHLKVKANGGSRLVISYMSIGEAEDYRYYWKVEWKNTPPPWLEDENPEWEGNYKVRYWEDEWKDLIIYDNDSYLNRIMEAGFDGVYLDIIDAFEYYEYMLQ